MAARMKPSDIIDRWPKRLEYTGLEKMLMALSVAILAATMVCLFMNYGALPAEIPNHYDFNGNVDDVAGKSSLLILAAVDVVCTFVMLMSGHFPGAINVPVSMLKRPAEDIIHGTRIYLYVTTILLVAFFWFLIEATMLVAQDIWMGLPSIGIWSFIALLLGSVGIYFYWLWRG